MTGFCGHLNTDLISSLLMTLDLLPPEILQTYEVHEWKHACAILANDFPSEWRDVIDLLRQ